MTKDNDLLEKCNTRWDNVGANIKKQCDSKPAYNVIAILLLIKM